MSLRLKGGPICHYATDGKSCILFLKWWIIIEKHINWMKMEITICHYQQLYGRREMREDYWFFVGKRASIFVVKLLHISKLKGIYWPAFEDLSSYSRFSDCWLILIMRNFTSLFYKRLWEYLLWRLFLKFEVDSLKK